MFCHKQPAMGVLLNATEDSNIQAALPLSWQFRHVLFVCHRW